MFCHKCGNPVEDGSNFCPKCGIPLITKETVVAEQIPKKLRNLWALWTRIMWCLIGFFWIVGFSVFVYIICSTPLFGGGETFIRLDYFFFFLYFLSLLNVIAAIAAIVTGIMGLRYAEKHPESKGAISSCISIVAAIVHIPIAIGMIFLLLF